MVFSKSRDLDLLASLAMEIQEQLNVTLMGITAAIQHGGLAYQDLVDARLAAWHLSESARKTLRYCRKRGASPSRSPFGKLVKDE